MNRIFLILVLVAATYRPALMAQVNGALRENAVSEAVSWSAGVPFTYDGSGNVRKVGNDTFYYDHAGRLIYASVNGIPRDYSYDAFGNRTGCRQWAGTSQQAECQKSKTVNAVENRNRIQGVGYDEAGNVTAMDGHLYAYDALNMMKLDAVGTQAREFLYTADDERIAVYNVGASWRWSLRDENGKVLREFTSSNGPNGVGTAAWQWARDNVWRETLLMASRQPENQTTATHFYHLDHLGSPRRVTDTNDRVIGSHDYFAFGPDVSGGTNEPSATALKYTGHERDSWGSLFGTLDYMHARYYDPELGRFTSVDPEGSAKLSFPQTWNKYSYTLNNPLILIDPDGRASEYAIIKVRVNVYYDTNTVDQKLLFGNPPLRTVNEAGIERARNLFSHLGIVLDIHRIDVGMMTEKGWSNLSLKEGDNLVLAKDVAKRSPGIDVFVTQGISVTGRTIGEGGPSVVGAQADSRAFMDEVAHALGNVHLIMVPLFSNISTDMTVITHEWAFNRGKQPEDQLFTKMIRASAEEQGCVVGDPDCK